MDNLIDFNTSNEEKVPSPSIIIDKSTDNPFIGNCARRSTESTNNPFDTVEYQASNSDDPFELLNLKRNLLSDALEDKSRNGSTNSYFSNASSIQLSLSDIEYSPQTSSSVELINNAFVTTTSIKSESDSTMNNGFITDSVTTLDLEVPKRRQSFSSSSNSSKKSLGRFNSVDNPATKRQQLLKLSFYNSPNSPMNDGSSAFNASLSDSVFQEAQHIAKKYSSNDNPKDVSFEDINNINPSWIDISDISETDIDLKDMKINMLPEKEQHVTTSNVDSAWLKAKLKDIKIKQEQLSPTSSQFETFDIPDIKTEKDISPIKKVSSPVKKVSSPPKNDLDTMFSDLKTMMSQKNHPDAQKLLNKFQEMIAGDKTSEITSTGSPANETAPKTFESPLGIVRQGTFDVTPSDTTEDLNTNPGPSNQAVTDDIMEQISKLLSSANLNTIPMKSGVGNATNPTYIVVMPQIESLRTPIKAAGRRSVSLSMAKKPEAALRAIENKRLFSNTPMKSSLAMNNNKMPSTATRRNSFATPRPSIRPVSLEQKQPMGGSVRRSIAMSLNNKSPVQRMNATSTTRESMTSKKLFNPRPLPSSSRRSTLLKTPIPTVKITSPPKKMLTSSTPRPSGNLRSMPSGHSTPAANLKRLSQTPVPKQRLSMVQKPSTRMRSMTDGKKVSEMPVTTASHFKLPANKENKSLKLFDN